MKVLTQSAQSMQAVDKQNMKVLTQSAQSMQATDTEYARREFNALSTAMGGTSCASEAACDMPETPGGLKQPPAPYATMWQPSQQDVS
jgi:hypothetical protein